MLALAGIGLLPVRAMLQDPRTGSPQTPVTAARQPDVSLRIAETTLELGPGRSVKTLAYNGQVPGPLLRVREGQSITVEVLNDAAHEEFVHWHGLLIPSEVDGAREEGTPPVPGRGGRRQYTFTPNPSGTRWYHSHGMTRGNLQRSTYTGQFGVMVVESGASQAVRLDVPIVIHEWDARLTREGPLDVEYRYQSINGRMLGAGDPVRVRQGQRVLFRIVNASATLIHQLALPGARVPGHRPGRIPGPEPARSLSSKSLLANAWMPSSPWTGRESGS